MESNEIRKRFLAFFEKRGHTILPSASLVPENDPTVLFTTAGMQPLIPYLLGTPHPAGKRLVNVQKCVRTQDIEEVGDNTHDTFFEMLGNWSLGDYFKEDAIKWSYEFLTSKVEGLGLDPSRLYVTCFEGDENAPRDEESAAIWKSLGVPEHRIYFLPKKSNWWSPGPTGPCGPDTEMFYDVVGNLNLKSKEEFLAADERQEVIEIWNDVFMEYEQKDGKVIGKLSQKNVDTGAGLERLAMMMQGKNNIFDTDLLRPLIAVAQPMSLNVRDWRIIADHMRTAIFMIADGVTPSNTDKGSVLRRLIRRVSSTVMVKTIQKEEIDTFVDITGVIYKNTYKNIQEQSSKIKEIIWEEILSHKDSEKGRLERGLKKTGIAKIIEEMDNLSKLQPLAHNMNNSEGVVPNTLEDFKKAQLTAEKVFYLNTTEGISIKQILEIAETYGIELEEDLIEKLSKLKEKHREVSRQGAEQKFKGGLADTSEQSVRYHTATHLLHKALRDVLGETVFQKGSNITPERLRFDFSFDRKMTPEEIKKVEDLVNEKIKEAIPVTYEDISKEEASTRGAIGLFEEKYGDIVRVYKIGEYSLEYCGGPHVTNTKDLGTFKIVKEEAVAAGIRRIKAVLS